MFASFAFAQAYFAGVLEILRRAVAGGIGGSGIPPDWSQRMMANQLAAEREERRVQRELARQREEIEVLSAMGLL